MSTSADDGLSSDFSEANTLSLGSCGIDSTHMDRSSQKDTSTLQEKSADLNGSGMSCSNEDRLDDTPFHKVSPLKDSQDVEGIFTDLNISKLDSQGTRLDPFPQIGSPGHLMNSDHNFCEQNGVFSDHESGSHSTKFDGNSKIENSSVEECSHINSPGNDGEIILLPHPAEQGLMNGYSKIHSSSNPMSSHQNIEKGNSITPDLSIPYQIEEMFEDELSTSSASCPYETHQSDISPVSSRPTTPRFRSVSQNGDPYDRRSLAETVDLADALNCQQEGEIKCSQSDPGTERNDGMSSGGGEVLPAPKKLIAQQSTVWSRKQNAVCVRRARKTYGSKSNQHVILDNLSMTVPKGCIYGLLGASGCGKTTLLSCIVGRKRLNSGEIWVLGGHPGTKGSGVPGPRIGYMPQEMALYGEFTIRETLLYFGWVAGMTTEKIEERAAFLLNLLQLPGLERYVKDLSGGQQRRVSMAATFLHEPELLILDEPTVGIDPLIRQSVWDYLVEITADKSVTIIITTHYIDETKQASKIGLMRGGRFLAEESPDELLQRYNSESLEDAFLKLSVLQTKGKRRRSSISSDVIAAQAAKLPELNMGNANDAFESTEISGEFGDNMSVASAPAIISSEQSDPLPPNDEVDFSWKDVMSSIWVPHHMKALIWKNFLWMFRNIGVMFYVIGMPIMETCLFCWAIGRDPVGLHIGVVNHEIPFQGLCTFNSSCVYERLSCRYLHHLSKRNQTIVPYSSVEEARYAVVKGWAWGFIDFPDDFSNMLAARVELGRSANDTVLLGSEMDVYLDQSNHQILFKLQRDLILSLEELAKDMSTTCQVPGSVLSVPIRMNDPVYGPQIPNFTDFAAPGVMLTIIFFLAVALTSGTMLIERNEGILERCLVSGITGLEILSSHVVTQFLVVLCQSILVILFMLIIFGITNHGNLFWILVLIILSGTCGMTYGFVVSCVCESERSATYLAMGSFLPFVMLCGIIWPVEGMNKGLQFLSSFLPLTLTTESLRSMLARGWGIDQQAVYTGFLSITAWIIIYMSASVLLLKFKKG